MGAASEMNRKSNGLPNTCIEKGNISKSDDTKIKVENAPTRRIDDNNILWIPVRSVNPHIVCGLCQGYLYEACTITECMHSFCKNCIVKHLERSLNCPMCAILIHPTDPFVHIRLDGLLQDIVYALLPHVEKDELEKERQFYKGQSDKLGPRARKVNTGEEGKNTKFTQPMPSPYSHGSACIPSISLCLQHLEQTSASNLLNKQFVRVTGGATVRNLTTFLKKKLHIEDTFKVDLYCPCKTGFVFLNNSHTLQAVKDLYFYDKDMLELKYYIAEH